MLANGMVMSMFVQLIQLWGGCQDYLLHFLQVLQNRTARVVTNKGWYTPVKELLDQCGWLSIKQLVVFHSLILVFKIRHDKKPVYLANKLGQDFSHNTRFSRENRICLNRNFEYDLTMQSFIPRATASWNSLPATIRLSPNLNIFKQQVKSWVKTNIEIT